MNNNERYPYRLSGEELVMALIFSKDRRMFIPQLSGKLIYFFLVGSVQAGVGLARGAEKLAPRL